MASTFIQLFDEETGKMQYPVTGSQGVYDKNGLNLEQIIDDIYGQMDKVRPEHQQSIYIPPEVAAVYQELGDRTNAVVSQKVITDNFTADRTRITVLEERVTALGRTVLDHHTGLDNLQTSITDLERRLTEMIEGGFVAQ